MLLFLCNNIKSNGFRQQLSLVSLKNHRLIKRTLLSRASLMPKGVLVAPKRLFNEPLTKSRVTEVTRIKPKSGAVQQLAAGDQAQHKRVSGGTTTRAAPLYLT